jgi:hypothetical protein
MRPERDDRAVGEQPAERDGRHLPSGEDELGSWREVLHEHRERVDGISIVQDVDVVDHEDERPRPPGERPRQPREREPDEGLPGLGRPREDAGPEDDDLIQRHHDVREEPGRVVVRVVDRHPDERSFVLLAPLGQQRRLPVPRRTDDQDERRALGRAELLEEPRTGDQPGTGRRHVQLRLERNEPRRHPPRPHLRGPHVLGRGAHDRPRLPQDRWRLTAAPKPIAFPTASSRGMVISVFTLVRGFTRVTPDLPTADRL